VFSIVILSNKLDLKQETPFTINLITEKSSEKLRFFLLAPSILTSAALYSRPFCNSIENLSLISTQQLLVGIKQGILTEVEG
jgi:hypothetical protein